MKVRLYFIPLLLCITTAAYCQTTPKVDKISDALAKCLDKLENQTTAGMCTCTYTALDAWDKELNATYKILLAKLGAPAKAKLIAAQREWIKYRDKEIDLIGATYGTANGTEWRMVRADKEMDVTRARAVDLRALLDVLDEL